MRSQSAELAPNRLRDLRSAVTWVAKLLGDTSTRIALDLPLLSARLAAINPIAIGLTPKSVSNIRSNFLAAVRVERPQTGAVTGGRRP